MLLERMPGASPQASALDAPSNTRYATLRTQLTQRLPTLGESSLVPDAPSLVDNPKLSRPENTTAADIEATRQILVAQQVWNDAVWEAYCARQDADMFECWADGHDWLRAQPKLAPTALVQLAWVEAEVRSVNGRRARGSLAAGVRALPARPKRAPVIPKDRQMEIALAALAAREERDAVEAAERRRTA